MSRGTSPLECDHRKKLTIPSTVSSTRSQKGEEVKRSLVVGGGCPEEEASIPGWLSEGGASGKCLSVTFVNLTMTRSRNMTMKNVGMSFAGCPPVTL